MNIYECQNCNHLQVGKVASEGTCVFCGKQKIGEEKATRKVN